MNKKQKAVVVYITDENYVMPTCISIISLQKRGGCNKYRIYILIDGLSKKSVEILQNLENSNTEILLITVNADRYSLLASKCISKEIHVSPVAIYKFNIPNILPEDKVLYLDSDIIINQSIEDLFETDVSESYIAAVDDMGDNVRNGESELAYRIGLKSGHYFNSGVMLLNLKMMRKDEIPKALFEYREKGANYFMDQDALNYVLSKRRISLDCKYNFMSSALRLYDLEDINNLFCREKFKSIDDCINSQTILHLTDKAKPWKYNIPWFTGIFLSYYNISPYKDAYIDLKSESHYYYCIYRELEMRTKNLQKYKEWKFPYERVNCGSNVVIYGAGAVGRDFVNQIEKTNYCNIVMWMDKNYENFDEKVVNPAEIVNVNYDYVIIAILNKDIINEVQQYLALKKVDANKIITI